MGWVGLCVAPPHHRFLYSVYSVIFAASHLHHLHTAPWQGRHKFVTMPPPIFCTPVLRDFCCFSSPPPPHGPVAVTSHLFLWRHRFSVLRYSVIFAASHLHYHKGPHGQNFTNWGWPPTRGDGHSHLGMVAHTWGWRLTPGDGRFTCGDAQNTDEKKTRREFLLAIVRCCFFLPQFSRKRGGRRPRNGHQDRVHARLRLRLIAFSKKALSKLIKESRPRAAGWQCKTELAPGRNIQYTSIAPQPAVIQ